MIVASFLAFPNIGWWIKVAGTNKLVLDKGENFQKMTYRNRYLISGANNQILLSIPIERGRNQHIPMANVKIFNREKWQVQHWRTLVSVYKRSPFFDHYEPSLKSLFEEQFINLVDFNLASIQWVIRQLKLSFELEIENEYLSDYPSGFSDLRSNSNQEIRYPSYQQVFEDRIGFIPNLSILDMLFSVGPDAKSLLIS